MNECSAFQDAMCDEIFNFEEDGFTIPAKVRLLTALPVLDQFKTLPTYGLFFETEAPLVELSS